MADIDQGNLKGAFDSLLQYIDKPWKILAVLTLAIAGFVGYFIMQNQEFLMAAYNKSKEQPKMESSNFDSMARLVLKHTGADLIVLFEVNGMLNTRKLLRMYDKDGNRIKDLDGTKIALFNKNNENNEDVVKMLAGEVVCAPYGSPQSMIGFFYKGRGINYFCRAPVPMSVEYFVGQVSVGWKVAPEGDQRGIMSAAADSLMELK